MKRDLKRLILASGSPRRKQLLEESGLSLKIRPSDVDETVIPGETPDTCALRLAQIKARSVAEQYQNQIVLGADTIVVLEKCILGKPDNEQDAFNTLKRLSGRKHTVMTGVSMLRIADNREINWVCKTSVVFKHLTDENVRAYIGKAHTLDKAGAYGIQEHGEMIVDHIEGLYSNVVGLPVEEVLTNLINF